MDGAERGVLVVEKDKGADRAEAVLDVERELERVPIRKLDAAGFEVGLEDALVIIRVEPGCAGDGERPVVLVVEGRVDAGELDESWKDEICKESE